MPPGRWLKMPACAKPYAIAIEPTAVTSHDSREMAPTCAMLAGSMMMPDPIMFTVTMNVSCTTPIFFSASAILPLLGSLSARSFADDVGVDLLEIGFRRRWHERQTGLAQRFDRAMNVAHAAGDVLDALALVNAEIFLDLSGFAGVLVDRNPDLAIRAGQRAREQARRAALDVEEADLAEVEQPCVE